MKLVAQGSCANFKVSLGVGRQFVAPFKAPTLREDCSHCEAKLACGPTR